jgi:diguanylate cyclase (GGDEF)-like protein
MLTQTAMPRLLLVDDDVALAQVFVKLARGWGYHVEHASSGRRALELARRTDYRVVVCEANLPDTSGQQLLEELALLQPSTAFVLTTQRAELGSQLSLAVRPAMVSIIPKPWDTDQLRMTLSMASELAHKRRERFDNLSGASVLILDDNPADAFLVAEYLNRVEQLTVMRAERLSEALRLLHDRRIDLIVCDLSLPDACGVDTVLRLRASAPLSTIIVCTGFDDEAMAQQLMLLGAQDYLLKSSMTEASLLRALRLARERKRSEERLAQMAFYDPLTGLANRSKFEENAGQALARARRRNSRLACMFIDLDGFKGVNDRLGHAVGDALLRDVAARMRQVFREYDTIARLGGDEFAILLTDIENYGDVAHIAARLCDALSEPIEVERHSLYVTASVGISVYPDVAESVSELIHCADQAMYDSKRAGKNRFSFSPSRSAAATA